jgi:hypothetical protein
MRKVIFLSILFILTDIIMGWIPIYYMNPARESALITFNSVFEGIAFRLLFAFWYWVVGYLVWILVNVTFTLTFSRSKFRSMAVSIPIPIVVIWNIGYFNPVVVWYCLLSALFGFCFHRFIDDNTQIHSI